MVGIYLVEWWMVLVGLVVRDKNRSVKNAISKRYKATAGVEIVHISSELWIRIRQEHFVNRIWNLTKI